MPYTRRLLIPFLLILACSCTTAGPNPAEPKRTESNETETSKSAEKQLFLGRWSVSYAAFATTAPSYYTFDGETVTVKAGVRESPDGTKRSDLPITWHETRHKYSIDASTSPKQLTMTPMASGGDKIIKRWHYEFREGDLWMCPAAEAIPPSTERLELGCDEGWLMGLRRVETAEQSTAN